MPKHTFRDLGGEPAADRPAPRRGRNLIAVIGIDDYAGWPKLSRAASDAEGMRRLFVERLDFKEIGTSLFNQQATRDAIQALVQDELPALLTQDDSLVLFFAGHGHTEERTVGSQKVDTGYLIPVGAPPEREEKHSTYIPLDAFLQDVAKLPARHVLVILDACRSGFALGQAMHKDRGGVDDYQEELSSRFSRRLITSAMKDQAALDDGPIPDHSLFTGTLIEALDPGKADPENRGFVTGAQLGVYLQSTVGQAAAEVGATKQTPDFGYFALHDEGDLVIPLRGETFNKRRAQASLAVADAIQRLGWITDDAGRFPSAARHYREAQRNADLAKLALPQAELGLGQALLASGDTAAAIATLDRLVRRDGDAGPADALFHLGLAHAKLGDRESAAKMLDGWCARCPDHVDATWVGAYVAWLRGAPEARAGERWALLIGIDRYALPKAFGQQGCVNDVEKLLKPMLIGRCGFQDDHVTLLTNEAATRQRCLDELEGLARRASSGDTVFVHFSGHSVPSSRPDYFGYAGTEAVYLILADTNDTPGYLTHGLSADELHQHMQAIPAARKTLILDTHSSQRLVDLARLDSTYNLIGASDTAEIAYEWHVPVDGADVPCGMLTGALYQALLAADANQLTFGQWMTKAIAIAMNASSNPALFAVPQTPYFEGVPDLPVFGPEDIFLPVFEFSRRRAWPELTVQQLTRQYARLRGLIGAPHPAAHSAFGAAFASKQAYGQAIEALVMAIAQPGGDTPESLLALAHAQLAAGRYADALASLGRHQANSAGAVEVTRDADKETARADKVTRDADKSKVDALATQVEALAASHKHAVLVGIDTYAGADVPPLRGAANDVAALKDVLVRRCGFAPGDVVELVDGKAGRAAILAEFERLVQVAGTSIALFYFAGYGSLDADNMPVIVSHDGRQGDVQDIPLEALAALAGSDATNLRVIIDADFTGGGARPRGTGQGGTGNGGTGKGGSGDGGTGDGGTRNGGAGNGGTGNGGTGPGDSGAGTRSLDRDPRITAPGSRFATHDAYMSAIDGLTIGPMAVFQRVVLR